MVTREQFDEANARAAKLQASTPKAVSARYDAHSGKVVVTLSSGLDVSFSPRNAQGLETAKAEDLASIEISPSGFGLYFPKIDADLYVPALLEGVLGSVRWTAARMGALGGKSRSKAKAAASRENGKLGGRPRIKKALAAKPLTKKAMAGIKKVAAAKEDKSKARRRQPEQRPAQARKRA